MAVSVAPKNLERLERLYTLGYYDTFIDSALQRIIERQIARDELDLRQIEAELNVFERDHGLTSERFWKKYQAGELADTADNMEWNVLFKSKQRIQERLRVLSDDNA